MNNIEWIPCGSERLPDFGETVLLCIETSAQIGEHDRWITIGCYDYVKMCWNDFQDAFRRIYPGDFVTHWAHLPKPPISEPGDVEEIYLADI